MDGSVKELTAAIASGNPEAFARFFRQQFSRMYLDAKRATGRDESFCLDVVQDAMVRVIRSIKTIDSEPRLRAWLRAVVQTCAYDRLRKEMRRQRREERVQNEATDDGADPGLAQRLEWLRSELAGLSGPQMQLLVLRYRFGWTLERIGGALGIKPGAVDGRIHRTLGQLRRRAGEAFRD